jgi:hypothetical protein
MLVSGYPWVVGRSTKEGEIQDVSIETTAEGLNRIQIARDAKDTDSKFYVVDRKMQPSGAWRRLLEVESFSPDALPDRLSEVRAIVEFETIPNMWGLEVDKTWGLPEGMESPWFEPVEMVGNELLLPINASWVSGDAPVNIVKDNVYSNGKYTTIVDEGEVIVEDTATGELVGSLRTDTRYLSWTEGIAGAAQFYGGSVYIEPAKPPVFLGLCELDVDPVPIQPGLYHYGDNYVISSVPIRGGRVIGAVAFVKDPYPQRWIRKMFGRAYVKLISPAHIPPLIEDMPRRIGIEAYPVPTDFEDITPHVVTPYADKTGVFNVWDLDIPPVIYRPSERPYDVLLPFDGRAEDWGGFNVDYPGTFFPAEDFKGNAGASFPVYIPYEMPDIPVILEGTAFYRWKDSNAFSVIKTEWVEISYREGWVYFDHKYSPDATGIAEIQEIIDWNHTKVEWTSNTLHVNDIPALTEEIPWGEILNEPAPRTWGEIAEIPPSQWTRTGSFPIDKEVFTEIPPTWMTGYPEGEVPPPPPDYSGRPRTWGRILYEEIFPEEV